MGHPIIKDAPLGAFTSMLRVSLASLYERAKAGQFGPPIYPVRNREPNGRAPRGRGRGRYSIERVEAVFGMVFTPEQIEGALGMYRGRGRPPKPGAPYSKYSALTAPDGLFTRAQVENLLRLALLKQQGRWREWSLSPLQQGQWPEGPPLTLGEGQSVSDLLEDILITAELQLERNIP